MLLIATLLSSSAWAGGCDATLNRIGSLTSDTVVAGFNELVKCDKKLAEANFNRYLEKATNPDVLVNLSMAAIDAEVWNPLWTTIGKIQSYEARDMITQRVGEACIEKPKIVNFLEGAYFGLRAIDFQQWDDAFNHCKDPALATWMEQQIQNTPKSTFDEKYDVLLALFVHERKAEALPFLTTAAIKAGKEGGPFNSLLAKMGECVAPELGGTMSPETQAKLEEALVTVAKQLPADMARSVAEQLANSGSEKAAAALLPAIYPDRVQGGGNFLYAAASIEAGDCGGKKSAVIHYTTVTEPGKRWTLQADLEEPMRKFKAKLKGCTTDGPWSIVYSPEPLKSSSEVDAWLQKIQQDWADAHKDYKLAVKKEKGITLP